MANQKPGVSKREISIDKEIMKEQAFAIAGECVDNNKICTFVDDEVYENMPCLFDLKDKVEHVDVYPSDEIEEYSICFSGKVESHRSRLVHCRTHRHPAEYEIEEVMLFFSLNFYPAGDGGLGDAEFEVERL